MEFIRQCGYERGIDKNKEVNGNKNANEKDIKITIKEFTLVDSGDSLVPKSEEDKERFNSWFKEEYENKKKN